MPVRLWSGGGSRPEAKPRTSDLDAGEHRRTMSGVGAPPSTFRNHCRLPLGHVPQDVQTCLRRIRSSGEG